MADSSGATKSILNDIDKNHGAKNLSACMSNSVDARQTVGCILKEPNRCKSRKQECFIHVESL